MITGKIKALFNFIEFLYSNIENFTQYDGAVNELHLLAEQRSSYRVKSNFKEKLKYDEVQAKIAEKYDIIDKNIIQIIKAKVIEFDICDWNETNTLWNNNIKDIRELTENFCEDDIQKIISNKNKYIEYRTVTKGEVYFGTGFFFSDLDEILKVLFDFFKESTINEFEAFETKTIHVDSIQEAVSLLNSKKAKPQKTKYNLFTFFKNLKKDSDYIQLNERLNNTDAVITTKLVIKGKDGTISNVYSAGMWYLLTNDEFANEGFNDAYIKGFEDGKQFISDKTNKALKGFYASCKKEYINELHYAYFFNAEDYILGYKNGACDFPIIFYIDSIEKIGFSAGVVTAIDLMAKENPILFDGFYDLEPEAPQQAKTNNTDEINQQHPKHNPNDWNADCFKLFKYLFDEYYNDKKRTNTKLICIWFYLSEYNPEKYILSITKDNYLIFIKINYNISITNKDKPDNYNSKVEPTLHEHRKNFEDSLK